MNIFEIFVTPRCIKDISTETHERNKRPNTEQDFNTVGYKMIGLMIYYEEEFAGGIDNKLFDSITTRKNNYQTLISNYIPAPKQENDCSSEKLQVVHDKDIVLKRQINIITQSLGGHLLFI